MERAPREAPSQSWFNTIDIPTPPLACPLPRMRLGDRGFASHFFENPRSRLTPPGFRCVYLAADAITAVLERWGDTFHLHRERGVFAITQQSAERQVFLEATLPTLKLCDLTHRDVLPKVGMHITTLHHSDVRWPRAWAERIAHHPARFDGVLYRSRHTQEPCLVLWLRPGGRDLERKVRFQETVEFSDSAAAYAAAGRCGVRLSFTK